MLYLHYISLFLAIAFIAKFLAHLLIRFLSIKLPSQSNLLSYSVPDHHKVIKVCKPKLAMLLKQGNKFSNSPYFFKTVL